MSRSLASWKKLERMSSRFSAPRDRWLPDGSQGGLAPTSPHCEAGQYPGANVVADHYRSPQTAYGHQPQVPGAHLPSTYPGYDPRLGDSSPASQMAYGTPRARAYPMHGHQTSYAPPHSPGYHQRQSLWHGGGTPHGSYVPYDETAMRHQAAYMAQLQHAAMQQQYDAQFQFYSSPQSSGANTYNMMFAESARGHPAYASAPAP